jgi:hypothetical protein
VRCWWPLTRPGRILAVIFVVSVPVTAALVLTLAVGGSGQGRAVQSRPLHATAPDEHLPGPQPRYQPVVVTPAATPEQALIDSQLSQAEQSPAIPAGLLVSLPAGGYSPDYPPIPDGDRNNAMAFGTAFVTELVDRSYARQYRPDLLSWAQAESAPNTLPGVPAGIAGHSLVVSLIDPVPLPGPVPAAGEWAGSDDAGELQTVSNIQAVIDPVWLTLTATEWQPADPAMTILTVTGTLTTGGPAGTRTWTFSLHLTVGSSSYRPAYGAVAVDDWTVS